LIEGVKVDFVADNLSIKGKRGEFVFENGKRLKVDLIENIYSNKFTTIVSRSEVKNFVDFYFISKKFKNIKFEKKKKDAIFDDPPTVAFQIEKNLDYIRENEFLIKKLVFFMKN